MDEWRGCARMARWSTLSPCEESVEVDWASRRRVAQDEVTEEREESRSNWED